ncbi:glycosyltransferase family 2 protein [Poritiphilus flavus]|uniref:Glycosyltransferase n=1 Tax=Poritiphilus flavus TaxID=2697053 RepID=A0A6L9EFF9_9FLAO|nr:glycosyltransferase family 2 protein [Poritiphilus flavus]NAS13505.1 glycosyltransferase [Poritiphilus flavus]
MQDPLVSILIPFKNTAEFLPACLDSILKQSYTHWEVLAVDDHSTDSSREILDSYTAADPRIKVFSNTHEGIIPALRIALKKSKGELISRMDSDDLMKPHKLQKLVGNLMDHGRGHVALGQVKYFSDRGISDGYARYERWINQLTESGTNYSEIYKECVIPSPCWMVYKEDLNSCGAFDPDRYPEDYDLTFRFYEKGLKCIPCREVLHLWRDYDSRTSRTSEHYAQNYFLDIKLHYFLKLNFESGKQLVIWGAGTKGKTIARSLVNQDVPFTWVCDNPRKIGKKVYGVILQHYDLIRSMNNTQSIVTVANEEAQIQIKTYLSDLGMNPMEDYFFFC